ncbi:hypothetical protein FA95DRAFT_1592227 [Auriscalpium vulgare]|uniref:Uncharacterized protein n=1 Tax=Auriscalpium vulgare TaxID=40419 RepID=A0ACB8SAQ1_9AGAM|nr:hypothetical protein FA95DRAFT_1592227 [Auriscalpium vulgare]
MALPPLLPPEILGKIFMSTVEQEPPCNPPATSNASAEQRLVAALGWVKVTHVCQRWREIALAHPSLWTNLDADALTTPWVEAFHNRSLHLPFKCNIDLTIPRSNNATHTKAVFTSLEFLQSLRVVYPSSGPSSLYNALWRKRETTKWSNLRKLAISMKSAGSMPPVVPHFFLNPCETLTSLCLEFGFFPYERINFPVLEHLKIHLTPEALMAALVNNDMSRSCIPSHRKLSALLARHTNLKEVALVDLFPNAAVGDIDLPLGPREDIQLPPSLQSLCLRGDSQSCIEFASHCIFPSTTKVEILTHGERPSDSLPKLLGRISPMRSLALDCRHYWDLQLRLWDRIVTIDAMDAVTPKIFLSFGRSEVHNPDTATSSYKARRPCLGLQLSSLTTLLFETSPTFRDTWHAQTWRDNFAGAVNLEHLYLQGGGAVPGCVEAMSYPVPERCALSYAAADVRGRRSAGVRSDCG